MTFTFVVRVILRHHKPILFKVIATVSAGVYCSPEDLENIKLYFSMNIDSVETQNILAFLILVVFNTVRAI